MQETITAQESLKDHFLRPRNIGEADKPHFVGRTASLSCGAVVQFSITVDEEHRILQAKFKAAGCDTLVAAASLLSDRVVGSTTAAAAIIAQQPENSIDAFGQIETDRNQCAALACGALVSALQQYSNVARDEWAGEEALICTCFFVSERTIESEVTTRGLTTVGEVTRFCSAGGGCGSCHPLIQDIIDSSKFG